MATELLAEPEKGVFEWWFSMTFSFLFFFSFFSILFFFFLGRGEKE
jgi:hypothetical protein